MSRQDIRFRNICRYHLTCSVLLVFCLLVNLRSSGCIPLHISVKSKFEQNSFIFRTDLAWFVQKFWFRNSASWDTIRQQSLNRVSKWSHIIFLDRPNRPDRGIFYPGDRDRPNRPDLLWTFRWCFHVIAPITRTLFGAIRAIRAIIWKPAFCASVTDHRRLFYCAVSPCSQIFVNYKL